MASRTTTFHSDAECLRNKRIDQWLFVDKARLDVLTRYS
jgi:hypothetical protein